MSSLCALPFRLLALLVPLVVVLLPAVSVQLALVVLLVLVPLVLPVLLVVPVPLTLPVPGVPLGTPPSVESRKLDKYSTCAFA